MMKNLTMRIGILFGLLVLMVIFAACQDSKGNAGTDTEQSGQATNKTSNTAHAATGEGSAAIETMPTTAETTVADAAAAETMPVIPGETGTALDSESYAALCALFADDWGWPSRALIGAYDTPEEVDLYAVFREGFIEDDHRLTDAEYAYLSGVWDEFRMNMKPCRLPVSEMNAILQKYLGLTLEQTNGNGLEYLTFFEDTNCYYHSHGDCNLITVKPKGAFLQDDGTVKLYYAQTGTGMDEGLTDWVATLCPVNGEYRFISNHPQNS